MIDEQLKKIGLVNTISVDNKPEDLVDDLVTAITQTHLSQMVYARAIDVVTTVRDGKEFDPKTDESHNVKYVQTTGRVTDVAAQVMGLGR
jgi:sRNA-binding regulator protein Hfq